MKHQEDQHHIERGSKVVIETRNQQVRSTLEYLNKWKKFLVEDSTWEDENFIQSIKK